MENNLPGLILTSTHAQFIAEGKKTAFVKSEAFKKYVGQPIFIVADNKVWAKIKYSDPKRLGIKQFKTAYKRHLITETERLKWWPGSEQFFIYDIELLESFIPALDAKYTNGSAFTREVEVVFTNKESVPMKKMFAKAGNNHSAPVIHMDNSSEIVVNRSIREEIPIPGAKRLDDWLPDSGIDVEKVITATKEEEIEDEDTREVDKSEEKEIVLVRGKSELGQKVNKFRKALGRPDVETVELPAQVSSLSNEIQNTSQTLVDKFKERLRGL